MSNIFKYFKRNVECTDVDLALDGWRSRNSREERLSESTRARILGISSASESRTGLRGESLASLFLPARRLAFAGVLPAAALTLALGALLWSGSGFPTTESESRTRIDVVKQGEEVIFVIANGERSHRIYRSADPRQTGSEAAFGTTNHSFRDRLDAGNQLVFYRVD